MNVTAVFAGVPVADLSVSEPFYERVFGRPAKFHPNDEEAVWPLGGAWL